VSADGGRVTVTTARTLILTREADSRLVWISNPGPLDVDIGGATVTSGAGYVLSATKQLGPVSVEPTEVLYGVTTTGTSQVIHVLTVG
jgi:hypothetical protein